MNNEQQGPSINPQQVAAATLGIFNRADVKAGERETVNVCANFLEAIASGTLVVSNAPAADAADAASETPAPAANADSDASAEASAETADSAPAADTEAQA